jgi:hypothetical protein
MVHGNLDKLMVFISIQHQKNVKNSQNIDPHSCVCHT